MSDMSAKQPRRQKKGASNSGAATPANPALASTPVETSKVNVWHFLSLVIHFVHFNLSLQLEALDIPSCRPRLEAAARRPKLGGGGAGQLGGARREHRGSRQGRPAPRPRAQLCRGAPGNPGGRRHAHHQHREVERDRRLLNRGNFFFISSFLVFLFLLCSIRTLVIFFCAAPDVGP